MPDHAIFRRYENINPKPAITNTPWANTLKIGVNKVGSTLVIFFSWGVMIKYNPNIKHAIIWVNSPNIPNINPFLLILLLKFSCFSS